MQNLAEREPGGEDEQDEVLPAPSPSSFEQLGLRTLAEFARGTRSARLEIPEEVDS